VSAAVPSTGRVLDFGCGHGAVALYLAIAAGSREITGVDLDRDKLEHARVAATRAAVDVEFTAVDTGYRPMGTWDAITVVDVLYLLDHDSAMAVIDAAADALAPGGVLVVKEVDVVPRRKFWPAAAQEVLATKVLRITEGGALRWEPPQVYGDRMHGNGLQVEHRSLHRGRLHPHHLVLGHKPA